MQKNNREITKSFYIYSLSVLLLTLGGLYIIALLDKNTAFELSNLIMNVWWYSLWLFCGLYALFLIHTHRQKIKTKLYQSLYSLFYKTNTPCLILDKRLNIVHINHEALLEINLFQNKIKHFVSDFTINNIKHGNYNFKKLDPKHSQISGLSIFLNSHYSNKYKYNNLSLNFKTRPLKLLGYKIGIFLELSFENNANFKPYDKPVNHDIVQDGIIKPSTIVQAKSITLDQQIPLGNDYVGYDIKNQPKTRFTHEPFNKIKQFNNNATDQNIDTNNTNYHIELEDLKLKLLNIMLQNKLNKTIEINRSEYLNLYHSVDKLISRNKPELILQKVN